MQVFDLQIGDTFSMNGMLCTKKSARTAFIDADKLVLWFYFGYNESVRKGW